MNFVDRFKYMLDGIEDPSKLKTRKPTKRKVYPIPFGRDDHKLRMGAELAVKTARSKGELQKASTYMCSDCGSKQAEEYHHESYAPDQWLVLTPLCRKCHGLRRTV